MGAERWEKILEFVRWRGGKKVRSEQRKQCFLKHGSQKECGLFSSLLILLELREFVGKRKEMKLPWVWSGEVWQEESGFIEVNWELLKGLEESERILFALKKKSLWEQWRRTRMYQNRSPGNSHMYEGNRAKRKAERGSQRIQRKSKSKWFCGREGECFKK